MNEISGNHFNAPPMLFFRRITSFSFRFPLCSEFFISVSPRVSTCRRTLSSGPSSIFLTRSQRIILTVSFRNSFSSDVSLAALIFQFLPISVTVLPSLRFILPIYICFISSLTPSSLHPSSFLHLCVSLVSPPLSNAFLKHFPSLFQPFLNLSHPSTPLLSVSLEIKLLKQESLTVLNLYNSYIEGKRTIISGFIVTYKFLNTDPKHNSPFKWFLI